ncbi:hypothetical protein [Micromonospora globbae]|uniref:hypothetical protein n=1 Tax=Micromonospora globbae TaxID=1894969 RepID=UPI0037B408EB
MARWLTPRWLLGHLIIAGIAAVCLRLGWWQFQHAVQGDLRSLGYALQWPLFAVFGVFFWVRIVQDRTRQGGAFPTSTEPLPQLPPTVGHVWSYQRGGTVQGQGEGPPPTAATPSNDDDPEAAVYADMLEWLKRDPRRRLSEYPGIDPQRRA